MAISYTPPSTSNLIGNPSEGGSFSDPASAAELQSTVSSAAAAKVSETAALASKNAAATSEANALASKNAAATSATGAYTSSLASALSETAAELAETNAEAAETNAETAEANALAYKNAAASSSTTASNAANAATASQAASAASQISAISSENASNANASNASNSAGAASTSATASATSATASATSATASETSRVASVAAKDLAEDWATKTSSAVEGSNFSAKYYSTVGNVPTVAGSIANVNTVGTNISNVNTVGGISGNVTTVAGIASNVTTVADIDSNVTTAADIASNITTVAGISGNVTTVAGINQTHLSNVSGSIADINTVASANSNITSVVANATNITSVAGNASNINTVAANSTNINSAVANATNINSAVANATNINSAVANATNISTVASNISSVNNFSDVYRIASSAPTSSLTAGDLYFDTSSDILKVYGASGWQSAGSSVNGTSARFAYTLTANQTTVTGNDQSGNSLLYDAGFLDVYLNGVKLHSNDFTASSGNSIVLAAGATANDILEVVAFGTFSLSDGTFPGTSAMGTITVTGTVDGRDVATDGTKLDTIETNADVTDTINVTAAGALMDSELADIAAIKATTGTFLIADQTKLDTIETSATADQTKSDIEGLGIDLPAANLTGTIAAARLDTATTQAESDDSTKIATTAYVVDKITTLIGGAPSTLDDLNELAAAINDDSAYNSTLVTALATKMPKSGGAFTGAVTTNSTFDGVDIAARDAVLTSTTTVANAALPKAGGTMTGALNVGGTVTADGLTVNSTGETAGLFTGYSSILDANSVINGEISLGSNAAFQGRISYEGQSVGVLYIENTYNNDAADIVFRSKSAGTAQNKLKLDGNGDISFYEDTGSTAKLFWDASAESLGIGTSSPQKSLDVEGSIRSKITGGATSAEIDITSGGTWRLRSNPTTGTNDYGFDIVKGSAGTDVKMSISSSGSVGIGTSLPSALMHISGSSSSTDGIHYIADNTRSAGGPAGIVMKSGHGDWKIMNSQTVANALEFIDGGSPDVTRMIINSSGNVGIGVSDPTFANNYKGLEIGGNSNSVMKVSCTVSSGWAFSEYAVNDTTKWITGLQGNVNAYRIAYGTNLQNDAKLSVMSDGKVGIGTLDPNDKIHIKNGFLRIQAADQSSGSHASKYGVRWTQETDVEVARIEVERPAWGGAPSKMNFYTRTPANALNNTMAIDEYGIVTTPYQPAFTAWKTSHFATTSGSRTEVGGWSTTANHMLDVGNNFNESTGRFTAPVAGKYWFQANIMHEDTVGDYQVGFHVNGTATVLTNDQSTGGSWRQTTLGVLLNLNANQYVSVFVYNSNTVIPYGVYGHASNKFSTFTGYLVG